MNEQDRITSFLKENKSFITKDFVGMVKESQAAYSERKAYLMLQDLQDKGRIMKVGRGHYSKVSVKSPYHFKASSLMDELVSLIDNEYPLITGKVSPGAAGSWYGGVLPVSRGRYDYRPEIDIRNSGTTTGKQTGFT